LRTGVASVFSAVVVRTDANFLYGFFVGRDHGGAAPCEAVHFDAVDLVVVRGVALAVGVDLHLIFGLENAATYAGTAGAGAAGSVLAAAIVGVSGVAEDAGSEAKQLEWIAAERGQILDVFGVERAADLAGFGVDRGSDVAADGDGLRDVANFHGDVDGLNLFGGDGDIGEIFFLEAGSGRRDGIVARREAQKIEDARRIGCDGYDAARLFIRERDRGGVDRIALGVEHAALNSGAVLGEGSDSKKKKRERASTQRHNSTD